MYVCVCVYHMFFIHSSVDGHLGYLHILEIVNNAALNTGMHFFFQINAFEGFLDIHPGVELFSHMVVVLLLDFDKLPYSFP